jgi:hypothetical protein
MNKDKKIILILIFLVIITGLGSFISLKYKLITDNIKKNESNIFRQNHEISIGGIKHQYYETQGKTIIEIDQNQSVRDIIKNYKYCNIFAGMPLEVSQVDTGLFELKAKSALTIHEKPNLDLEIGDRIIGSGWIAEGFDIGRTKQIQILKKDNTVKFVEYKIVTVLSCF